MTRYRYKVQGLSVLAVGPRGGTRWIASYNKATVAADVAAFLNRMEGS